MKDFLLTLLHLAVTIATLCGAGGVRAVIAENLGSSSNSWCFVVVAGGAKPVAERPAPLRIRVGS